MIEIQTSTAVFIYFVVYLGIIFGLWIREIARVSRNDWELSNSKLFHCDNCHHAFLTKDGENLTRCPMCNSICIAKKHNHF